MLCAPHRGHGTGDTLRTGGLAPSKQKNLNPEIGLEDPEESLACRCGGRAERHGRVVQEDAHLVVLLAALVAERVLHLDLGAVGRIGEYIVAHGDGDGTAQLDLVVVVHAAGPAPAAVDGEAFVFRVALLHVCVSHEVGHGVGAGGAELVLGALGRLKEHVPVAVAVQLSGRLARGADEVAAGLVDGRDFCNGRGPLLLHLADLSLSHGQEAVNRLGRRGGLERDRRVVQEDAHLRGWGGEQLSGRGWRPGGVLLVFALPERRGGEQSEEGGG
eukprot:scaffold11920_cov108-Isochrysis_galbana.AAC.5